jgi:hypothetical protein
MRAASAMSSSEASSAIQAKLADDRTESVLTRDADARSSSGGRVAGSKGSDVVPLPLAHGHVGAVATRTAAAATGF